MIEEEYTVESYQKLQALAVTHLLRYASCFTLLYASLEILELNFKQPLSGGVDIKKRKVDALDLRRWASQIAVTKPSKPEPPKQSRPLCPLVSPSPIQDRDNAKALLDWERPSRACSPSQALASSVQSEKKYPFPQKEKVKRNIRRNVTTDFLMLEGP